MQNNKGFTLIELLIVIAILAVLATIAVISYGNATAQAQDATRANHLKTIQAGLELYFNDNSYYPAAADGSTCNANNPATVVASWTELQDALASSTSGSISVLPVDPDGTNPYRYATSENGMGYVLVATASSDTSDILNNDYDGDNIDNTGSGTWCHINSNASGVTSAAGAGAIYCDPTNASAVGTEHCVAGGDLSSL